MTIIIETSTDKWTTWRIDKNSNFSNLNTRLIAAEEDIDEMFSVLEDSSDTSKWLTKVSSSPASPTNPIAVWTNDSRIPTQDENNAASWTYWTPSSTNKFVTETDPAFTWIVKTTWDQTIWGIKTFTSIPVLSWTPTNANDLVTKSYMDTIFANF